MEVNERFSILYTHQKLKKHKSWKDGFLVIKGNGNTIIIYDENNYPITTFLKEKKHQYSSGSEIECAKFLIQIEDPAPSKNVEEPDSDSPSSYKQLATDSKSVIPAFKAQKRSNPYLKTKNFLSDNCKKPFCVPKRQDPTTKIPEPEKEREEMRQTLPTITVPATKSIFTLVEDEMDPIFGDIIAKNNQEKHLFSDKENSSNITYEESNIEKQNSDDCKSSRRKTLDVLQLLQTQPTTENSQLLVSKAQTSLTHLCNRPSHPATSSFSISPSTNPTVGRFSAPKQNNSIQDKILKSLFFASKDDLKNATGVCRNATIPVEFETAQQYCESLTTATREYINLALFNLSKNYHDALRQVNLEPYTSTCNTVYTQENNSKNCLHMSNSRQLTTYLKRKQIVLYCEVTFVRKANSFGSINKAWSKKNACYNQLNDVKKKTYLQLPYREASSAYNKNDVWIVSMSLNFAKDDTFIARSSFFGPSSDNLLEIEFMGGCYMSKFGSGETIFALHAFNASTELSSIENIEKYVNERQFPLLPHLLNNFENTQNKKKISPIQHLLKTKAAPLLSIDQNKIESLVRKYIDKYYLNQNQQEALDAAADMLSSKSKTKSPLVLIHGVFGSGKSYLLSIIILFFSEVAKLQPEYNWKILLSSTTNVAVDRVLSCLLDVEFTDICRVGCFRKISHNVLPYSVHTKDKNEQIKELKSMLANKENSQAQRQYIRKSLEQVRKGLTELLLDKAFIVGATCASTTFPYLATYDFPIVIIDECTQITEPHILLPLARFSCQYAMLVGDPNQLPPTIEGVAAKHSNGLEQTLFTRLKRLKYQPIKLRMQYRCHPKISKIANEVFYNSELKDGVDNEKRPSMLPGLQPCIFFDISDGMEARDDYSGSFTNTRESNFICELIKLLLTQGVSGLDIGIIALYKAQVAKIKQGFQNIDALENDSQSIQVSTVDAFQGAEKPIIILSCVRTTSNNFVDSKERLCVALTRGKYHLFIVGHLKSLKSGENWQKILNISEINIQTPFQFRNKWSKKM